MGSSVLQGMVMVSRLRLLFIPAGDGYGEQAAFLFASLCLPVGCNERG
jgi:hypothetical protein